MSQAVHLIAKGVPGYGPSEGRLIPCSGVSGKTVVMSPWPSHGVGRISSQLKFGSRKSASRIASFVCNASSGGHRRNPDFSRHNKQGSRNRNRQMEERDSFENFDDSDILTSKNGPLLSLSGTSKAQATAAPGPREKEIVELFRKVQAQLRERAAVKEEKKVEASQRKGKENETVDSLLRLLRKHSIEHGKKKSGNISGGDFVQDQPQQNGQYNNKTSSILNSNSKPKSDIPKPDAPSTTRPPSNFQRKSPVPQAKFQSVYSTEESINSTSILNSSGGKQKQFDLDTSGQPEVESEVESDVEPGFEEEPESEPGPSFPGGDVFDELSEAASSEIDDVDENDDDEQQLTEQEDLYSMKLAELRALAKSRGLKGFSKMKKSELIELLNCGSP